MANYRIVKYCRMCKKRFVVDRTRSKEHYCEDCMPKYIDSIKNEPMEDSK